MLDFFKGNFSHILLLLKKILKYKYATCVSEKKRQVTPWYIFYQYINYTFVSIDGATLIKNKHRRV